MTKPKYLGDEAKAVRKAKGLTQARAAEELGVSLYTWRIMEQGYLPKRGTFQAKVLTWVKKNKHFIDRRRNVE